MHRGGKVKLEQQQVVCGRQAPGLGHRPGGPEGTAIAWLVAAVCFAKAGLPPGFSAACKMPPLLSNKGHYRAGHDRHREVVIEVERQGLDQGGNRRADKANLER